MPWITLRLCNPGGLQRDFIIDSEGSHGLREIVERFRGFQMYMNRDYIYSYRSHTHAYGSY